jgi:hypothetical protein
MLEGIPSKGSRRLASDYGNYSFSDEKFSSENE